MFHDERVVYHSTGEEYSKRTESCSLGRALFVENEVQSEWLTNSRGEPRERTFISLLRKRNGLGHESRGNLCPGISVPDGNPAAALETSDLVGKIFAKKKKKTKGTIHYSLVDQATARNYYWPSFFFHVLTLRSNWVRGLIGGNLSNARSRGRKEENEDRTVHF